MPNHVGRELVITVPLPEDRERQSDGRRKVHRYRSLQLELGRRLRAFRVRYGVTQREIARAVGASDHSAVCQWESGVNVPDGLRRERLVDLLAGRLWPQLREAALVGEGLPAAWDRGVRWYRRASRERRLRETLGGVVVAVLDDLRASQSLEVLWRQYRDQDGEWVHGVAGRCGLDPTHRSDLRRVEDAAYGLRWLELAHGLRLDPRRSLVPQFPLGFLNRERGGACAVAPPPARG